MSEALKLSNNSLEADREAQWAASVRGTVIVAGRSTQPLAGMKSSDRAISATGAIALEERCVVLYARVADGVSPDQGYAIRDTLNAAETNGWWFMNPGAFVVVFLEEASGASRASSCEAALRQLAAEHPSWAEISIGMAAGKLFGAFSSAGILESMPVGGVVSAAMQKATNHAS